MRRLPKTFRLALTLLGLWLPAAHTDCAPDTPAALRTIQAQYGSINHRLGHCRRVKRDIFGRSAEGGELIGYRAGSSFCKVTAIFFGESGKAVEEYYFRQGELFFVLRSRMMYRQPLGVHMYPTPEGTVDRTTQERFYLNRGNLIRWLGENNLPQTLTDKIAQERVRQLTKDAHAYLTLLRSPESPQKDKSL